MEVSIQLTQPHKQEAVLRIFFKIIDNESQLQELLKTQGILFELSETREVIAVQDRLIALNYSSFRSTETTVHLLVPNGELEQLTRVLVSILSANDDIAQMLWSRGLTLENIDQAQANTLKQQLEAESAQVTIINGTTQLQYIVTGQVRRPDHTPFDQTGYTLRAFDVISDANIVPLSSPTNLSENGVYRISYNWQPTAAAGRDGPNLVVRLLSSDGTIVAQATKPVAGLQESLDLTVDLPTPHTYVLFGTVKDQSTNDPFPFIKITANFISNHQILLTQSSLTGTRGDFKLPFKQNLFDTQTAPIEVTFQLSQNNQPLQTATRIDNLQPHNQTIEILATMAGPGEPTHMIRGRIVSHELRGLTGLSVVAVDKNVGGDTPLGESASGDRGVYEIHYSAMALPKEKPDVQIQVLDQNGEILVASAVRYNAKPVESSLDIVIPAEKLPRSAEYRRLLSKLGFHLGNPDQPELKQQLATLKEDEQQQDISYLANKTGWDARMVAMASLASQFSQRSGIEPEFYYALFRTGVPANETVLSQLAPETVQQVWERAVEQQILPAELQEQIPERLVQFQQYSASHLLEEPAQIGISSFQELIAYTLDQTSQQAFAKLYYDNRDDLESFWDHVRTAFPVVADRLQLDGKLGFLTMNNVPLIQRLHDRSSGLQTPLDLVRQGLFQPEAWQDLLGDDLPIPTEIPGAEPAEKKANYAALMASQLRLSYPTAVVTEMIYADLIPLQVEQPVKTVVTEFLEAHQGKFELGIQPIEQYLRKNNITLASPALAQIKMLQRVYQISPSDEAMGKLLEHELNSAYAVVRYDEHTFIRTFKEDLGGEAMAKLTYAKAHQVHHAVLNITTSYLLEKSTVPLYALQNLPTFREAEPEENGDVLAQPTLENVLGEIDYCACKHCRSWLSPAAYLVDLLQFLDLPIPATANPLDVLLERRPDIQHLQLTCENTNTVLPYIDLVNEVLEHYVVNGSLDSFTGHNIEAGVTTEELMANPKFVNDAAYTELRHQVFPPPLPFHQPLEALRRHFDHFQAQLPEVMERLRQTDQLNRVGSDTDPAYGWRDVLMERLQLSRPEYTVLTDSTIPLQRLYGEDPNTMTADQLIDELSMAKTFAHRLNLTYEELIAITRTQFINPHSHLIPKLAKLAVTIQTIQDFLDGTLTDVEFRALLPLEDLDITQYGGNAEQSEEQKFAQLKQWLQDHQAQIMGLILLSDLTDSEDFCSFNVKLRYALPDIAQSQLKPIEFLKLLRFIRLWRKLGWSIEQTDKAIAALYPSDQYPIPADDADTAQDKLDSGFHRLILRLAHVQTIMSQLKLTPKRDLTALLACWSSIDTHGPHSLYRQMFLNLSILALDHVFQEDGYGNYLQDATQTVMAHTEALRAAFNLTQTGLDLILVHLGFDQTTELNLANVSAIFRYGYLARQLRLSPQELLALKEMSGLDPFLPLDLAQPSDPTQPLGTARPPAIRLLELAQRIKDSPLKVSQLLYFLQHIDLSGQASPTKASLLAFAQTLRNDLLRVDREHMVQEDPTGEIAKAKMALVYGDEAPDIFFGLLNHTSTFSVEYHHGQVELEDDIRAVTNRISYDDFQKQLSVAGVMTDAERTALQGIASATDTFRVAVQALFESGQAAFEMFFDRYPELRGLYDNFVDSNAPLADKMSALLADFLPDLRTRLKRQQVRQTVSAEVDAELTLVTPLLENADLLHAVGEPTDPAIADFLSLEIQGLTAIIFFADDVVGNADQANLASTINYRADATTLPLNPADPNAPISGFWRGLLEAPDNGFYNFSIEADPNADISLILDGAALTLALNDGVWRNQEPIELEAGQLSDFVLIAKRVKDLLVLKWERKGMGRAPIPAAQLYPAEPLARYTTSFMRLLKVLAIAEALELSSAEMAHFAAHDDYKINQEGWLNALPVTPSAAGATTQALLRNVLALLQYRMLKATLKISDDGLLELLQDPSAVGEDNEPLLNRLTDWQDSDLNALLNHFSLAVEDLAHLEHFDRLDQVFAMVKQLGISAANLITNTTNAPTADMLRALQAALRAHYDQSAWLQVIQPINHELRSLQRDALVAYVLHRLGQNEATRHINTPDKLFEYFLIDVLMDPCMKTSRIKQALASVQLFVQRCLLNLEEPQVESASINARQWEWMKRYRVWEANRKVFLWPENWLEPELRDNKSSFFKDLESELLQSDITDDAAATALVHYLEKLDEVAKLEICGIFYEENKLNTEVDDFIHVIARTAGARRTYYYRRQENGTSWTPWEKIDLNIEDNPVAPVVWKGRLFLFWVSVLQEAPEAPSPDVDIELDFSQKIKSSDLKHVAGKANTQITVVLYWSEHYHGKWQPPRTSDVNSPLILGDDFSPSGSKAFDRAKLNLQTFVKNSGQLIIFVGYEGKNGSYYRVYNSHSLPIRKEDDIAWPFSRAEDRLRLSKPRREVSEKKAPLIVTYNPKGISPEGSFDRKVLNKGVLYEIIDPRHRVEDVFAAPFFFQDRQHVFFVKSKQSTVLIGGHLDVGLWPSRPVLGAEPTVLVQADLSQPQPEFFLPSNRINPGVIDPSPLTSFLKVNPYIHQAIGIVGTIQFGDRLVGPGGSMAFEQNSR